MENKKITVVNATGLYPPQVGGPATRSVLFENYLPEKGIDVRTVAFTQYLKYPSGIRHFLYYLKLRKTARDSDVIVAQDAASVGWPASIVAKKLSKPFVVIFVGDFAWEQGVQRFGIKDTLDQFMLRKEEELPPRVAFYRRKQTEVLKYAEKVVVPSNYLKRIVMKWGISEEKITVIYNSFEEKVLLVQTKEELRKYKKYTGKIIFSAGRLVPWKGFGVLIGCIPELKKKFPDLKLYIAGEGPEKKNLELQIKELELENTVFLLGSLTHATDAIEMSFLASVKAADLFVLNTGYEGLSHQLLEVMSLGTPIVTTDVGGNPELIVDGKEGLLVPYNDKQALSQAIARLLSDAALQEELSSNAKKKVRSFTVSRMIEQITTVIESVCKF